MEFYGYHGDLEAERVLGGRFQVDVELRTDLGAAGRSDALDDTIDYVECFHSIRKIVEDRQFHLLEALAEAIAGALLEQRLARGVRVRVAKQPPVAGRFERVAVVIDRERLPG